MEEGHASPEGMFECTGLEQKRCSFCPKSSVGGPNRGRNCAHLLRVGKSTDLSAQRRQVQSRQHRGALAPPSEAPAKISPRGASATLLPPG